ncbi:LPS export ABC transporter periplasmic protein LptC [Candidatus Odyssella thessalonicensis]|uniref:LPS export ABC transporter periplasmic protein LptC n=1 Tax=Candidatus Odyssella thessalonicensis TaxID=84647 RepID=UPI000225C154|nr:LPS export ABC transporter periplasmic protein LptC [Candidatus Odyssella thessalonicensis]
MINSKQNKRRSKLKYILPTLTLLLIVIIAYWPHIHRWISPPPPPKIVPNLPPVSLEKPKESVVNEAREIHFDGVDKSNQPYTLTAEQGTEFKEGTIELINPKLQLRLNSGQSVALIADKAVFYKEQQKIELINHVKLTHTTGYEFITEKAWLDMTSSTAFGHEPISGKGPQGKIFAKKGFKLTDKGEKISFMGRPELLIEKESN